MSSTVPAPTLRRGDRVELVDQVPGHLRLRAGLQGHVVVGDDVGEVWGMVTVAFPTLGNRPWQLHRRHLRRLPHVQGETPCP
jgi:hypothetical protein